MKVIKQWNPGFGRVRLKTTKNDMWKKMLPGIICSAVIIGVLIYFIDWNVLTEALKNCSVKLFLILFALQTISFFCRGMAWRVILDPRGDCLG